MTDSSVVERAIIAAADLFSRGASVLVACSGGADSVALAAGLARCAGALGVHVAVGHVDHALRADSARDAERVRSIARRLDLPFHVVRLESLDTSRLGLEAAAREERYRALASLARAAGADLVATAHTRRDQAETVLLRLARGGGPGALAAIRRVRPLDDRVLLVRPLLDVPREATEAYCAARGLPFLADPHNADPRRARTRVRELFPVLADALNPRLEEALAGAARLAGDEDDLLDAQARSALEAARTPDGFRTAALAALPKALARRALLLAAQAHARPERRHLEAVLAALGRDFQLDVPGGRAVIAGGLLRFDAKNASSTEHVEVIGPGRYVWCGRVLQVGEGALCVDLDRAPLPWTLRHRCAGDRLEQPSGRAPKIADLWSAARIPGARRSTLAVLADARGRVFWAEGVHESAACAGEIRSALHFGFAPEMGELR
jgi:tRNA(Ile)-lysidine synthase